MFSRGQAWGLPHLPGGSGTTPQKEIKMFEQEIKQARWKLGLTQKQLADLLNCTEHTVQNWESGRVSPKFTVVLACRWLLEHPEYVEAAREREES